MATPTSATQRSPTSRWVALAGFLVLAGGIAAFALRSKRPPPEKPPLAAEKSQATQSYPIPSFERPEEAKRYFDAMIQGDTRAIEELDRALAKAKDQRDVTPAFVNELERVRAERVERLEAHQRARPE